jgi:uncharacterized protein
MTIDEIRAALGKRAPPSAAALQEAVRLAAALVPDLLGLTERARRGVMLLPWQADFLRYALHALAAAGERAGWPALVDLLDLPEWQLKRLLGEDYAAVVTGAALSLYDGDADAMYVALENPCTEPGIRRALFEVLARLVWEERAERARLIALIDRFDAENLAPPGDAAWEGWQSAIGLLGLAERAGRVRESWRNGRLPLTREAGQAQFLALLAEAEARPDDPGRFAARRIERLADATLCLSELRPRKATAAGGKVQDDDPAIGVRLSDAELDWLDDFLGSEDFVLEAMSLPGLDGFLTCLVVGPEPVSPSEYLPEIFGTNLDFPLFEDAEQEAFVTALVMRHWNTIAIRVERGYPVRPLLLADVLADDASEWAQGFMLGMAMREHAWQKLIRDPQGAVLVGVVACLAGDPAEEGEEAVVPAEPLADTVARLPGVVAGIAGFWRDRRARSTMRRASRTGRNDPCPCGSGKIFRQCCGAPGRVLS